MAPREPARSPSRQPARQPYRPPGLGVFEGWERLNALDVYGNSSYLIRDDVSWEGHRSLLSSDRQNDVIERTDVRTSEGYRYRNWTRPEQDHTGAIYLKQPNVDSGYLVRIQVDQNRFRLSKLESGTFTNLMDIQATLSKGDWYAADFDIRKTSPSLTVIVRDSDLNELGRNSVVDETFTDGVFGFRNYDRGTDSYHDSTGVIG